MATIIDGKKISAEIREDIKQDVIVLSEKYGKKPGLAVVLVGNDPASTIYVRNKEKACEDVGFQSFKYTLDENISSDELLNLIIELNENDNINGILVQLPLPEHLDEGIVINTIKPDKDVDAFHPINVGKIMIGDESGFLPCTPAGCQELIIRHTGELKGKHLVVVGRSNIVGKPLANMMVQKNNKANCIVTIAHTAAKDLSVYTKQADILVVAAGRANTITANMVKDDAIVIDVGMNRIPHPEIDGKTKLVGDVSFDEVADKVSAITPVPGGVGPMTITMLLKNTLKAYINHNN